MGGIHVDIESIKNKDNAELQQMILFLKAQLVKYQHEIASLKKNDYYTLVTSLEQENNQLANQKKGLSLELMKLKKSFEKELNALHEDIQFRENQRIKQISAIEALVKTNKELQTEHSKLTKALKEAHNELTSLQLNQSKMDSKNSVGNMNNLLRDFIQKNEQQLSTINEELIKNRHEAIDINRYLLKELEHKSNKIDILTKELEELKEPHRKRPQSSLNEKTVMHSTRRSHLDSPMQKALTQSINFETQLNEKLRILDELEHKLTQLAIEIDNKQA